MEGKEGRETRTEGRERGAGTDGKKMSGEECEETDGKGDGRGKGEGRKREGKKR